MPFFVTDDVTITETTSSPMLVNRGGSKSATPSPVAHNARRGGSLSSQEWHSNEEDIDRLVAIHHNRSSLSSLGVSTPIKSLLHFIHIGLLSRSMASR